MAECDYVRLAAACHCGEPVKLWTGRGRRPIYCEEHREPPRQQELMLLPARPARPAKSAKAAQRRFERTCEQCGAGFTSPKAVAAYCSPRCRGIAWRAANPERMAALRSE